MVGLVAGDCLPCLAGTTVQVSVLGEEAMCSVNAKVTISKVCLIIPVYVAGYLVTFYSPKGAGGCEVHAEQIALPSKFVEQRGG